MSRVIHYRTIDLIELTGDSRDTGRLLWLSRKLRVAVSVWMHNRKMEGMILDTIADVYSKLGHHQKASSYHERAISTMKQQEPAR